ncbi:hypothetical protein C9374_001922 [Naegleria lovaniensis]|uniref:Uncharacterized protein n=1 Tax=Naegleria lovaniensis TaxID=51637 RepID=A0AA88GQ91_NAELO|nr:uncharacterized protein C9374_001922 [Naegleria lovaniensis]KAG2386887.1 hypothetical protein C9374_001922 [Naegleria lovaniensis]
MKKIATPRLICTSKIISEKTNRTRTRIKHLQFIGNDHVLKWSLKIDQFRVYHVWASHKNEKSQPKRENAHDYASLKLLQRLAKQALASNDQPTAVELYSRIIDCLTMRRKRLGVMQQESRGEDFSLEDRAILYDAYLQRSLCTHSIEDASQMIELTPEAFAPYYVRGLYYSSQNEKEKALQDFNKVLKMNPDFSDAYIQRAKLYYLKFKDNRKAIQDFERAFQLSPKMESIEIYYLRVAHLCTDASQPESYNLEKANEYMEKALRSLTEKRKAVPLSLYNELFSCCYELHRYEKALYWAHQGIKYGSHHGPQDHPSTEEHYNHSMSMLYYHRGNLLWHQRFKRQDLAIRDLEKALSFSPNNIQALLQLALLYLRMESSGLGSNVLQQISELLDRAENELNRNTSMTSDQQNEDDSSSSKGENHSWNVHYSTLYSLKGQLYLTKNSMENAMEHVNRALQIFPDSELAYFIRGLGYVKSKELLEKARQDFEQALTISRRGGIIFTEDEIKEMIQNVWPDFFSS